MLRVGRKKLARLGERQVGALTLERAHGARFDAPTIELLEDLSGMLGPLLDLQRPRSTPPHPDELLFIVVHQSSELWFKAILHELDGLVARMQAGETGFALWHSQRINSLTRIVSAQLSSLDTLPPQHFAQFREHLGTSSGSQSAQFRAIEAASGLRDEHFLNAIREHGDPPAPVSKPITRTRRSASSATPPARWDRLCC